MTRGKQGWIVGLVAVALWASFGTGSSDAATILRFDLEDGVAQEGTVSWNGGTDPLVGSGINFSFINLEVNGIGMGSLSCVSLWCMELEFNTGANSGNGSDLEWDEGAGWFFRVIATEDDPFGGVTPGLAAIEKGDELLTGTRLNSAFVNGNVVGLEGYDTKELSILEFFGLDPAAYVFASTEIKTNLAPGNLPSFSALVTNADVTNTAPAPGAAWLLAMGLSALVVSRHRKA